MRTEIRKSAEYRFVPLPDGFRVEHPQRQTVTIGVRPGAYEIAAGGRQRMLELAASIRDLSRVVGALLLGVDDEWQGRRQTPPWMPEAWAIAPAIERQRDRLMGEMAPDVLRAQAALQELGRPVVEAAHWLTYARHPYLLRDVANHRAAAIALVDLEGGFAGSPRRPEQRLPAAEIARAMAEWRGRFSPDGRAYRSLDRTLMNLPALPARLVTELCRVRLEQPVTEALPLQALLLFAAHAEQSRNAAVRASRLHLLQRCSALEVQAAVALVAAATRRRLCADRCDDLRLALDYIADCPEVYQGRLPGLARRAIRWHQDAHLRVRRSEVDRLGGRDAPTARPPIDLPGDPRIQFLATVGAVVQEGERMQHCIAHYAGRAVAGVCFLFHVDFEGEMATFEVSREGEIRQGSGPRNARNQAVAWGHLELQVWATPLRPLPRAAPANAAPTPRPHPRRRRRIDPRQLELPFAAG